MASLLIRNIHTLVTMVDGEKPLHDVDVLVEDGRIAAVGSQLRPEPLPDRILDGSRCVAYPGFVNTHHHLYQTLTRNIPKVQDAKLFDWLTGLYEVWRELDPEAVEVSTRVGLGELLLSGCTTTTDHFYVFPKGAPAEFLDVEIDTAREMGVRFHPTRGSMSRGRSDGGLPPDDVVQKPEEILKDCERLIAKYHDPEPFSMCRIVLAPCSPFSVTTELLAETAVFAREKKVFLHTHLCETRDEEDFCMQVVGQRPLDYMEKVGWTGPDVWFAHGIYFNDDEIKRLAQSRTGVAHCPASNLRLGSGICKVPQLMEAGVRVGLAVDGSASNDSSSFLREMQIALLVHRVGTGVEAMPPRRVLQLATTGGASILGQPEIGRIQAGMAADMALFRLDRIEFAGAMTDPASAPLFCGAAPRAEYTVVAGRVVVEHGHLAGVDEEALFHRANRVAERMLASAEKKLGVSYR
ncbi:MAG TPA: 8-oxoguanine deaminase [Holophaga sp.]|nr:8-oxoguanine deaminase [Holophaga sp.]